jgi:hypothetical protein
VPDWSGGYIREKTCAGWGQGGKKLGCSRERQGRKGGSAKAGRRMLGGFGLGVNPVEAQEKQGWRYLSTPWAENEFRLCVGWNVGNPECKRRGPREYKGAQRDERFLHPRTWRTGCCLVAGGRFCIALLHSERGGVGCVDRTNSGSDWSHTPGILAARLTETGGLEL